MERIVLVNPPQPTSLDDYLDPPLGLMYIASNLEKNNIPVRIVDLASKPEEKWGGLIGETDIMGVTIFSASFNVSRKIAALAKKQNPGMIVVVGGPHPTSLPEQTLSCPEFDKVITGEGEVEMVNLINNHYSSKSIPKIIKADKLINLDNFPSPARHLIDLKGYHRTVEGKSATSMITCYDENTEVLTLDGWKYFKDITYRDKIATLKNGETLEYQNPCNITSQEYSGNMINIKSEQIDLLVTPEHNLYVDERIHGKWKGFKLIKAKDLIRKNILFRMKKNSTWNNGKNVEYIRIPRVKMNNNRISTDIDIPIDLWLEFFGYFISEGCTYFNKHSKGYMTDIAQSSIANPTKYKKIEECIIKLSKYGFNYTKCPTVFQISSKQLHEYLKCYKKSHDKYIPTDLKNLSRDKLNILLDALVLGDGYSDYSKNISGTYSKHIKYFTASKKLIDDIQEILLKIGLSGNIKMDKRTGVYQISFNLVKNEPSIKYYGKNKERYNLASVRYNGKIYCCEVPNHIIYIRRNGKPIWSGNSRGCPYFCSFCCRDIHGSKVRFHSVDRVINEVTDITHKYGINSLLFYDDIFTINHKGRLDELCKRLKPFDITFRCNGRVGVNKPEDYKKLKEAGCEEVAFGIESGAKRILEAIGKRVTVKENEEAIKYAKEAGLKTKTYLMVGFPGETQETVDETKRFIERADPDKFTLFAFVPLPGCDVWKNPKKYGITQISQDWDQYFNIAGQYEGGVTFETKELSKQEFLRLHDDLAKFLMAKGQRGGLEQYYSKIKK